MSDPQRTAIQAQADLDQQVEAAYLLMLRNAKVTPVLVRGNPDEARSLTDDELRYLLQMAKVGSTYVCIQKMTMPNV